MDLKENTHRIKLIISLFTNLKYRYRVDVEDYFPETWDATVLNYYYFNEFAKAQKFVREYKKPFYIIRLFEQSKKGFILVNLDTGQLATRADEEGIDYHVDMFGYSIPVELSAGWYRRGWHVHHPMWEEVTKDLTYMLSETIHRYIKGSQENRGLVTLDSVIKQVFKERHPDAPKHFRDNFRKLIVARMEEEARKAG